VGEHNEDEEHVERRRRNREEIDRHQVLHVILQERAPFPTEVSEISMPSLSSSP
jgi:hypothetical protein